MEIIESEIAARYARLIEGGVSLRGPVYSWL